MEIAILGDQDTMTGFRFAGIKKGLDYEKADRQAIHKLAEGTGVLIVTEKAKERFKEELAAYAKSSFPIIVEIPDKHGSEKKDMFAQLVKKIIGVEIIPKGDKSD